ncbi:MAG: DUF4199 domain-containing protein [Ignavibacteria bacterium]|nr:DUF4199 domain-containing protein [Ignavibacteria bacterium]
MGKKILFYGLIAGGVLTVLFLLSHMLFMKNFSAEMWETGEIIGYSSMLIALTAIFFGVKTYRDKVLGGKITFGRAFTLGIGISAVAAFIFGVYVYILYTAIAPDLSGKMIEIYREKIKTSGQTQEVISRQLEEFDKESALWNNPYLQSFVMLLTVFMIGVVISLVTAVILKKKIPIIENTV